MHSNIITLAFCVLAIPATVTARPNVYSLSERSIAPVARAAHPITLRRRNQRAQVEQVSCNTPAAAEAGKEAAAGVKQKEAAAGQQKGAAAGQQKEAAAGEEKKAAAGQQKEAAAEMKQKEAAAEMKQKEAAAGQQKEAAAGEQKEAAAGEGEAKENEVEIESAFDTAVPVQGGDLKQDLVFTPSTVGKFEFEFQSAAADEVTVTENAGAATIGAPAGFEAIEPNSYTVALSVSKGAGVTLSKIDYIFDTASAGLVGKDITKAQVGKLCAETGTFVIGGLLGELEFEAEENEVTLNLNKKVTAEGRWGIFVPVAAAAGVAANGTAGAAEEQKAAAEKEKLAAEQNKMAAEQQKAAAEKEVKQKEKVAAEAAKKEKAAAEKETKMKEQVATEAAKKENEAMKKEAEVAKKEAEAAKKEEQVAAEAAKKEEKVAAEVAKKDKMASPEAAMMEKAAAALAMAAHRPT